MNAHEGLAAQATRLHAALALCLASRAAHAKGSEYMLRLVASDERRRAPLSLHSLAELLHVSPFRRLRSPPQADSPADTSLAAMRAAPSPPCGRLPSRHAGGSSPPLGQRAARVVRLSDALRQTRPPFVTTFCQPQAGVDPRLERSARALRSGGCFPQYAESSSESCVGLSGESEFKFADPGVGARTWLSGAIGSSAPLAESLAAASLAGSGVALPASSGPSSS